MKTQWIKSPVILKTLFVTLLATLVSFCGGKELATYNGGKVTEKDYKEILKLYNLEERDNLEFKKNIVRQIAIINTLSDLAIQEKLDQQQSFQYFVDNLMYPNIAKNLVLEAKKKELEKEKNRLYRARHILVKVNRTRTEEKKDGSVKQVELTDQEYAAHDLAARKKVEELRAKILSGEIDFEKAASEHSEDGGSKIKGGDLGYFTRGIMVDEFQNGLDRLAGEAKGEAYRVIAAKTEITDQPGGKVTGEVEQNKIIHAEAASEGWVKLAMENREGYISLASLEKLDKPGKISYAIRSMYGWHIIELVDTKMADFDDFVGLVAKTEFKDVENAESQAKQKVNMYWSRLQSKKQTEWQSSLNTKYGIPEDPRQLIDKGWQSEKVLFESPKMQVTSGDLRNFVDFLTKEQNLPPEDFLSNIEELRNLFQYYLEMKIFQAEAKEMGLDGSGEFERRAELERKSRLATIYVESRWVGPINVSNDELKAEYERYKTAMKANKQPVETFSQMKDRIKMRIEQQRRQMKLQMAESAHLKQIAFVLSEDLNEQVPPPAPGGGMMPPGGGAPPPAPPAH